MEVGGAGQVRHLSGTGPSTAWPSATSGWVMWGGNSSGARGEVCELPWSGHQPCSCSELGAPRGWTGPPGAVAAAGGRQEAAAASWSSEHLWHWLSEVGDGFLSAPRGLLK